MTEPSARAESLLAYIDQSPTPYHAVALTTRMLQDAGFRRLDEREAWRLKPGDRCFVTRNASSVVAFVVGSAPPEDAGFLLVGAHTDSPGLKLKPNAELDRHGYRQLGVEPYGGLLLSTWLDRDLGLAGRIISANAEGHVQEHLVHFKRPILRIPNIAIHLNRDVNTKGLLLDQQKHMAPVLGLTKQKSEGWLRAALSTQLQSEHGVRVSGDAILDFDIALVDVQPAAIGGLDDELLFAPRLDNLASCQAALTALIEAAEACPKHDATRVIAFWDNEECGSRSMHGAQGPMLRQVIDRVVGARSPSAEQSVERAIASSFLVSADMAHAIHPNYADRHEPSHAPMFGRGPVIKHNANQSYASDAVSAARFASLCKLAGFEAQRFVVRSDMPCGSTIGPITAALTGIKTVDVGNPMLSMHSIREMAATSDHAKMVDVLLRLFGANAKPKRSVRVSTKVRSRRSR